jgi:hypothetical protein
VAVEELGLLVEVYAERQELNIVRKSVYYLASNCTTARCFNKVYVTTCKMLTSPRSLLVHNTMSTSFAPYRFTRLDFVL